MGLGDFQISNLSILDDPCPPLQKKLDFSKIEGEEANDENPENPEQGEKKTKRRRTLKQNERIIYAPNCNLGMLSFETTGGYVTIPKDNIIFTKIEKKEKLNNDDEDVIEEKPEDEEELEEGVKMVRELQDITVGIDQKLKEQEAVDLLENIGLEIEKEEEEGEKEKIEFKERKNLITTLKNTTRKLEHVIKEGELIVELKENMVVDDIQDLIYGLVIYSF